MKSKVSNLVYSYLNTSLAQVKIRTQEQEELHLCIFIEVVFKNQGFPGSSAGKESACNAGDPGSIPGSGRSSGEGIGYHSSIPGLPSWLSPPDSSVHGIFHTRILEWIAIPFSKGSSLPSDQTWISCISDRFFTI